MSIAGQCGTYMPVLLVTGDSSTSLPIAKAFKECGAQKLRLQYQNCATQSVVQFIFAYNTTINTVHN